MFQILLILVNAALAVGFHTAYHQETYRMQYKEPFWMQTEGFMLGTRNTLVVGCKQPIRFKADGLCVVMDNDQEQMMLWRKMNDPHHLCLQNDIENPIFNPSTFDHIFLRIPLMDLKRKEPVISQLVRIVKPNGNLYIIDYDETHPYKHELNNIPWSHRAKLEYEGKRTQDTLSLLRLHLQMVDIRIQNGFKNYHFVK